MYTLVYEVADRHANASVLSKVCHELSVFLIYDLVDFQMTIKLLKRLKINIEPFYYCFILHIEESKAKRHSRHGYANVSTSQCPHTNLCSTF